MRRLEEKHLSEDSRIIKDAKGNPLLRRYLLLMFPKPHTLCRANKKLSWRKPIPMEERIKSALDHPNYSVKRKCALKGLRMGSNLGRAFRAVDLDHDGNVNFTQFASALQFSVSLLSTT